MKNKIIICFLIVISSSNSFAYLGMTDMETTRTQAMAGTGVGSVLLNEAPLLNPASIVFYNQSSFYYQKDSSELKEKSDARTRVFNKKKSEIMLITDSSSGFPGGFSYQYQNDDRGRRIRYSLSLARNAGKKSALGLTYSYSDESSRLLEESYSQITLGGTHILNEQLILGMIIVDPGQTETEYFRYTIGAQYSASKIFNILADFGSGDVENYETESYTKWAIQLQSFQRMYLRYGRFHDKLVNQKGTAVGISWVGPKLSIDYSYKISEFISDSSDNLFEDEQFIESSVGLTVLF